MTKVVDKEKYMAMGRSNFMEHSYDIVVIDTAPYSVGSLTYYGNIYKVEGFTDIQYVSSGIMLDGFEYTYNNTYNYFMNDSCHNSKLLFCDPTSTQILKIGKLTLNLKHYTKEQVIGILKNYINLF